MPVSSSSSPADPSYLLLLSFSSPYLPLDPLYLPSNLNMEFYCRPHFSQHQQRGYARGVAEGGAFEAQHHPPFAAGGSYAHHHQPFSDPTFGGMEEDEDMSFPIWLLGE